MLSFVNTLQKMLRYLSLTLGIFVSLSSMAMEEPSKELVRVALFNIVADFFNKKEPEFQNHNWEQRRQAVFETIKQIDSDILGLQELSPTQALEMANLQGYRSLFLSQTPSDVQAGLIVEGKDVEGWIGKNMGTPIIGILYKDDKFALEDKGRFWLKEDTDSLPIHKDRGETDKGFGNMNTYRGPIWVQLRHLKTDREIFVFNSHYPLSGTPATRFNCAKVERQKIDEIAKDKFWISMGDRNTIFKLGEFTETGDRDAMKPLLENAYNAVSAYNVENSKHQGPLATWAGFNYETCKNPIVEGKFQSPTVMDVMVSNHPSVASKHVVTQFNPTTGEIELNPKILSDKQRNFASDHLMVVGYYNF